MVFEIGRICLKVAGREAGKLCCIVDVIDKNYVIIDGNVKRRKCNINHLEPLPQKIEIKKGVDTTTIIKEMSVLNLKVKEKKPKKIEHAEKPMKKRKTKIEDLKPAKKKGK